MASIFDKFTNKYSLSKTLRFELKPVGNTTQMLQENHVIQIDEDRKKAYENTKPYFDRLHREFINESLDNVHLQGLSSYSKTLKLFKANRSSDKVKKQLQSKRKELREQVVSFFDKKAKQWATENYSHFVKNNDLGILFKEEVFQILKERYGEEEGTKLIKKETGEIISIFDSWKGFTGYFKKFFETRKNLYIYKSDGKSTALATRIIDQNLDKFLGNLEAFKSIRNKINISEVESFFKLKADEVFTFDFYNNLLLQKGIDLYNDFLGGKTLDNGEKKRGINEIINKYRQDHKDEKIPFLKKLDKQILSERDKIIDEIETQEKLLDVLKNFYKSARTKTTQIKTLLNDFFKHTENYDLSGIYLSKEALNTISRKWTNETDSFNENLYATLKAEKLISSSAKKKDGSYSFPDYISLASLKSAVEKISTDNKFWKERYYEGTNPLLNMGQTSWEQFLIILNFEFHSHFVRTMIDKNTGGKRNIGFDIFEPKFKTLLNDLKINKDSKVCIKNFADEVLHIYQMAKYFALEKKRSWDTEYDDTLDKFYTDPENGYLKFYENAYEEIVQPYNMIRNYLTKKPYSEEKWKLNFDNPTLANGWDKNKEADNTAVILRKEGKYYLAVMKKGKNKIFYDENKEKFYSNNNRYYEKLTYKLMRDPKKDLPKGVFSEKGLETYKPSEEIYKIYKNKSFKNNLANFSKRNLHKLIDFYKKCIPLHPSWKIYDFKFSDTGKYETIKDFYDEVSNNAYKIWFESISEEYIDNANKLGNLYLFQIYNKDFADKSTGKKNLHTIYFENLFSEANKKNNFPLKLKGKAELFYRPKSLEVIEETRNPKRKIISKRRYTQNKIFFHVPVEFNRTAKGSFKFNTQINEFIANSTGLNIIGIDRGEKHLAYFSVINQQEKILDSGSLNVIGKVDYHQKLKTKAEEREQARRDWQDVEGIKDLKKGYISQVVRKIADLAIKYNAIIVMEDLNMRFKQIRGGIEKSTYQQLEKALIEKLSFLVDKGEVDPSKAGHLLKAYQLTAPFKTFKDMGKQTGIIFYTQASYTSKIDPLTGWRPNIYLKYSSAVKARIDILKFKDIKFNNNRFEFTYDLKNFSNVKELPNKTEWTVCSNVERFRWDRKLNNNKGGYRHYSNLTEDFKNLFKNFSIDINHNLINQIKEINVKGNEKFFKDFIFFFNLICQIRNIQQDKDGDENDFILSPVEPFFDSRKSNDFGKDLPKNGDDNGAYNIARKGIIIINRIIDFKKKNKTTDKLSWKDLYISPTDWDNFAARV